MSVSPKIVTEVLEVLDSFGPEEHFTYHDIATFVNYHETTVGLALSKLANEGKITRLGAGVYQNKPLVRTEDRLDLTILKTIDDKTYAVDVSGALYLVKKIAS